MQSHKHRSQELMNRGRRSNFQHECFYSIFHLFKCVQDFPFGCRFRSASYLQKLLHPSWQLMEMVWRCVTQMGQVGWLQCQSEEDPSNNGFQQQKKLFLAIQVKVLQHYCGTFLCLQLQSLSVKSVFVFLSVSSSKKLEVRFFACMK